MGPNHSSKYFCEKCDKQGGQKCLISRGNVDSKRGPENTDVVGQEIEQLFLDHYDLLYAAAKRVTNNKHDAEDIVQTLFLKFVGQKFWPEIRPTSKGIGIELQSMKRAA